MPVRRTGLLSFQQTHIYARSGTYWLHAKAISGCSGQAESTLEVQFSTVVPQFGAKALSARIFKVAQIAPDPP
jgi:hypothetical protein